MTSSTTSPHPSVGRMLNFWPRKDDNFAHRPGQPLPAVIVAVNPAGTVNLTVFNINGHTQGYLDILLLAPSDPIPVGPDYATWPQMAQQVQQAHARLTPSLLRPTAPATPFPVLDYPPDLHP